MRGMKGYSETPVCAPMFIGVYGRVQKSREHSGNGGERGLKSFLVRIIRQIAPAPRASRIAGKPPAYPPSRKPAFLHGLVAQSLTCLESNRRSRPGFTRARQRIHKPLQDDRLQDRAAGVGEDQSPVPERPDSC